MKFSLNSLLSLSLLWTAALAQPKSRPADISPYFYKSHDLSSLRTLELGNVTYKDTARNNITRPAEDILGDGGMNTVRLRYIQLARLPDPHKTALSVLLLTPIPQNLGQSHRRHEWTRVHSSSSPALLEKGLPHLSRLSLFRQLGRPEQTAPTRRLAHDSSTPQIHPARIRKVDLDRVQEWRRGSRPRQSRQRDPPRNVRLPSPPSFSFPFPPHLLILPFHRHSPY